MSWKWKRRLRNRIINIRRIRFPQITMSHLTLHRLSMIILILIILRSRQRKLDRIRISMHLIRLNNTLIFIFRQLDLNISLVPGLDYLLNALIMSWFLCGDAFFGGIVLRDDFLGKLVAFDFAAALLSASWAHVVVADCLVVSVTVSIIQREASFFFLSDKGVIDWVVKSFDFYTSFLFLF